VTAGSVHCHSPFRVFDEFVLYVAGLHHAATSTRTSPSPSGGHTSIRITQFSLKALHPLSSLDSDQSDEQHHEASPHHPHPIVYTITYQLSGTKYCHRIGRQHRSNHVMYEANLNQGYVTQRCWDPDCRGYKSSPYFLPHSALPDMDEIRETILDIVLSRTGGGGGRTGEDSMPSASCLATPS
jgi:hypothetical protein